ncbi:helix-turn-helix domain-containing protein [Nonomuraea sp. NPDC050556]|uniref:helix-turn-helix domain-containing protein n=1 Tax=Nonomuraea sp. NPDC050556 TaxID=3364369 RepID=UPI003788EBBA
MKDLVGRLSALDPDAGAALQVIAYFDRLVEARAGLEAIVRGAAVLAGCPARLVDGERHVRVRVRADGRRVELDGEPDPAWPSADVPGGAAVLWLERDGLGGPVHAMVLERAAVAARDVLDRTRGRAPAGDDPALVELLLDASAPAQSRLRAARRLRVDGLARAVAREGADPLIVPGDRRAPDKGGRMGVGPVVAVLDLPESWDLARTALRFAAEGVERDPGPRVVYAEELGGLVTLAAAVGPGSVPGPDVRALDDMAAWMLGTLHAIAFAPSLRAAAGELTVHHSTLQDRLTHAEHLLGWTVRDPAGRLRLQLALLLRRLHRHP